MYVFLYVRGFFLRFSNNVKALITEFWELQRDVFVPLSDPDCFTLNAEL